MRRRKGFYSISVVAKMFSVHQQTIRMYEKEGLISPKRTEGNTRLFSEEDVDRLEEVIYLTHKMGVNLAGVQMILKLQKRIKQMQGEMNKLFGQMHGQLESESERYKEDLRNQGEKLVAMKRESGKTGAIDITENLDGSKGESESGSDDWEIDYSDN